MGIFDFLKGKETRIKEEKEKERKIAEEKKAAAKFEKLKDVNLKITEIYQDFQKKMAETDDGTGEPLTYWYDIIKKRVFHVPLREGSSFDLQVKELVYGNWDEYNRRIDLKDAPDDGLEIFSKMRIFFWIIKYFWMPLPKSLRNLIRL